MSLVTSLFFLVILLNQRWSPPLRLQASHCSTFRIMCDIPSIAVFCSESIECFPGTVSKFILRLLVHARGNFVLMWVYYFCISFFWCADYTSSHVLDDVSKQWKILESFVRQGRLNWSLQLMEIYWNESPGLASQALDLHTTLNWPKLFGSVPTPRHNIATLRCGWAAHSCAPYYHVIFIVLHCGLPLFLFLFDHNGWQQFTS